MISIKKLKPFTFYRLKPPLILPGYPGDRKKGVLVSVIAPSIEAELDWLSNKGGSNPLYRTVNLQKYYIEKYTSYKYYQQPQVRVTNDSDGSLTELINKYQIGQINGVTSFKDGLKNSPLKGYNTVYEINHVGENIIRNPKDTRSTRVKAPVLFKAWKTYLDIDGIRSHLVPQQDYEHYVFIPVNLWLDKDEYKSNKIFTNSSDNYFGHFVNWIASNCTKNMKPFIGQIKQTLVLINYNELMILSPGDVPDKAKPGYIAQQIKNFLHKCRTFDNINIDMIEKPVEQEDVDTEQYVKSAEEETYIDDKIDSAISKYGIKQEELSSETRAQLRNIVKSSTVIDDTEKPSSVSPQDVPEDPEEDSIFQSERKADQLDRVDKELEQIAKDIKKNPADIVVEARLAGQTVENYKRNRMLREKYSTLQFGGETVEQLAKKEKEIKLPDMQLHTSTVNDNLNEIKSYNFEKEYNDKLLMYDFARILIHFADAKPALYLVGDPVIEDISDEINRWVLVTVEYEDENRKRSKFRFKMPKLYQDKYLFLNEQKWNIIHQKVPYPVTKTDPNLCQVSTNYKKIRMSRFGNNVSAKVTKLKKLLKMNPPKSVKVYPGNTVDINKAVDELTTIEFDEFGADFYRLDIGRSIRIYFSLDDAKIVVRDEKPRNIPETCYAIGVYDKESKIYLDGMTNKIYIGSMPTGYELSDFIVDEISKLDDKFAKEFDSISAGTKFMYTRAKILDEQVPLIFVLSAADPGGLQAVLDKAKINHQFYDKRPTGIDKNNQGVVAFADGWLVFDRYPYENSLLLNGLSAYAMKEVSFYDMNSRDTYVEIFDSLFNRRSLIDGLENFYYLLIDPITRDVLERLHQPTEFTELLLYANGLLADNTYRIESDYNQSRLRSNEIINVYLYEELSRAYANYKYGRAEKFSIPENAVIKDLLQAEIVDSHSKLNITLEAENDRQVKLKGPGGLNVDRALTIEKRAYHPTMQGIIGINSTPSGEVGINRHMSLNSNIVDARGFLTVGKGDYDGTEIMTPGELLNTFACESADVERVAMSISQSKHLVPTADSGPSLVNYDMERVAPHMSNDFAFNAKKDGRVVAIENDIMIVQYSDGSYDDIDLSYHADKNTDGGFFVMNQMETDLKVGDRFKQNDIIAYDRKYISPKDEFGDNSANIGTLARVAVVSNGGVFEDACYISERLAKRLASKITREKIVTVSQFTNIKYIVKVGQQVKANDPLLVFDDTQDEFTSQLLASMADEANDTDEISATTAPVITKVSGTVTDIKIYYTVPVEELSPSLRKLVEGYTSAADKRKKFLAKYIDPKDANTVLTPSEQMIPDAAGRVSNIKVGDGVIIKIYVEYLDVMGVSDKMTNYCALKGVVSFVIPEGQEAYTPDNPDAKIDAYLSSLSIYKRMSLDIVKVGGISKILVEKKRLLKDKYLDRIKNELKKQ